MRDLSVLAKRIEQVKAKLSESDSNRARAAFDNLKSSKEKIGSFRK